MEIKELLDLIKDRRKKERLSQTEVAEILGITYPSYNQKENGNTNFELKELLKVFNILDIHFKLTYSILNKDKSTTIQTIENVNVEAIIDVLKLLRKQNKITQPEIAKEINLSKARYLDKEKGRYQFYVLELLRLFEILNIEFVAY